MIDLTSKFKGCLKAEAKEKNLLILWPRNNESYYPECIYELQYKWLSRTVENDYDENWVCVSGSECQYFEAKDAIGWQQKSLFDIFNLY